jgi:cysteinyl-tRNA synthetase
MSGRTATSPVATPARSVNPPCPALSCASSVTARSAAKAAEDYAEADRIRDELTSRGIVLEDSATGTTWRRA